MDGIVDISQRAVVALVVSNLLRTLAGLPKTSLVIAVAVDTIFGQKSAKLVVASNVLAKTVDQPTVIVRNSQAGRPHSLTYKSCATGSVVGIQVFVKSSKPSGVLIHSSAAVRAGIVISKCSSYYVKRKKGGGSGVRRCLHDNQEFHMTNEDSGTRRYQYL